MLAAPTVAAGCAYDTHALPRSPAPSMGPQHPPHAGLGQEQGGTEPRVPGRMPESSEVKRREQNQNQAMGAQASESESEEERDRDPNKQQNPRGRGGVRERKREVPGMW